MPCHLGRRASLVVLLLVLAAAVVPPQVLARSTPWRTTVLTENVRSLPLMPETHVRHDVRTGTDLGAVVMWQEIIPERYKTALTGLPGAWRTVQLRTENPVSFDSGVWSLVESHRRVLSPGRPNVSPQRTVTWAVLHNVATGRELAFVNTHFVSKAWSSAAATHRSWRRRMWSRDWRGVRDVVDGLTRRGLSVVVGGDYNRDVVAPFRPGQTELARHGIDHLWLAAAPGDDIQTGGSAVDDGLFTDHAAVAASVRTEP